MRPPALLVALALLALSVGAHARLLQEEPPQQQQCRPGKDKWDYYSCYAASEIGSRDEQEGPGRRQGGQSER